MYNATFPVSDKAMSKDFVIPIGKAKIERQGEKRERGEREREIVLLSCIVSIIVFCLFVIAERNNSGYVIKHSLGSIIFMEC